MNKIMVTTPEGMSVGNSFLLVPDLKRAEKFPRIGKDGTNLNLVYHIKMAFEPEKDVKHKEFIDFINSQEDMARAAADKKMNFNMVKPKIMKDKDSGKWEPVDGISTIEFKNRSKIDVFEGGEKIGGDKLVLDSKTVVQVQAELSSYDYTTSEGNRLVGISLRPVRIDVLHRPERKSFFKRMG